MLLSGKGLKYESAVLNLTRKLRRMDSRETLSIGSISSPLLFLNALRIMGFKQESLIENFSRAIRSFVAIVTEISRKRSWKKRGFTASDILEM